MISDKSKPGMIRRWSGPEARSTCHNCGHSTVDGVCSRCGRWELDGAGRWPGFFLAGWLLVTFGLVVLLRVLVKVFTR